MSSSAMSAYPVAINAGSSSSITSGLFSRLRRSSCCASAPFRATALLRAFGRRTEVCPRGPFGSIGPTLGRRRAFPHLAWGHCFNMCSNVTSMMQVAAPLPSGDAVSVSSARLRPGLVLRCRHGAGDRCLRAGVPRRSHPRDDHPSAVAHRVPRGGRVRCASRAAGARAVRGVRGVRAHGARRASWSTRCARRSGCCSAGSYAWAGRSARYPWADAGVAELVDAPGLGPGGLRLLEVQVLSPAYLQADPAAPDSETT